MRTTIDMALEAGFHVMTDPLFGDAWLSQHHESNFYKFEALVRADEREACAKLFDEPMHLVPFVQNHEGGCMICGFNPSHAAKAIRARGETK